MFSFLWPHMWHMEVPRLEATGAAAAGLYHSHSHSNTGSEQVCNLYHSSQQHWILNPLRKTRDRTHNLMVTS